MNPSRITAALLSATTALTLGASVLGTGAAVALPSDYTLLLADPNIATDSHAYMAGPPTLDPNGQPGASVLYTHRDGVRTITNTVLVLADPASATGAAQQAEAALAGSLVKSKTEPALVGTGGTLLTGISADGSHSVTAVFFTEANTAATVEFEGPLNDPAPKDVVIDVGREQDAVIASQLSA